GEGAGPLLRPDRPRCLQLRFRARSPADPRGGRALPVEAAAGRADRLPHLEPLLRPRAGGRRRRPLAPPRRALPSARALGRRPRRGCGELAVGGRHPPPVTPGPARPDRQLALSRRELERARLDGSVLEHPQRRSLASVALPGPTSVPDPPLTSVREVSDTAQSK